MNGLGLPLADRILLNKVVHSIVWDGPDLGSDETGSSQVQVICNDQSIYRADAVLVTCSLGFLKERADEIFRPLLPEKKRSAIQVGFKST